MKVVLRTAVAVAAAFLMAQGALAEDCDGECGVPSPPSLPGLPGQAVDQEAIFFSSPNGGVVSGTSYYNVHASQYYLSTFGGGTGVPFDGDVHGYGNLNSFVTLQSYFSPDPTIDLVAHQDVDHGRADVGVSLSYLVTLVTPNAATANAVQALMGSNPFATVQGNYRLSGSGYGESYADAYSNFGPDGDSSYSFGAHCDDGTNGSFPNNSGGCGSGAFNINLGFLRGDQFTDGNSNYFYAIMTISAEADAGIGNLGVWPGDAAAFIDPTITLSNLLTGSPYANLLTLDIGGYGPPQSQSAVPEPASWALMLGGFGLIGATMRNRRTKVSFA
jgi:hypothetical protein